MAHGDLYQARVIVPAARVAAALEVLENYFADAGTPVLSSFRLDDGSRWSVEALVPPRIDPGRLASALAEAGIDAGALIIDRVPDTDWVAESRKHMKPVRVGRFFVYPRHHSGKVAANGVGILIDPGLAFGTGSHETTRGCLLALDALARGRRYRRPLDLGCGSGVQAIAMAKLWHRPVLATDIDPVAARVTGENARVNGVGGIVHAVAADGLGHRAITARSPYDIIVANILAKPLTRLAPQIAAHLARRGRVVLSGLLPYQEPALRSAYRRQGLRLSRRIVLNGWHTLIMKKG